MNKRIGLALGSGAMRGLAHIGVMQVLEREGIHIDVVAGTSMGAVIAGSIAAGRSGLEMERIACELQEMSYFDLAMPRQGLIAGNRVKKLCGQFVYGKTFEEARMPCAIVACDLATGEEVVFSKGSMEDAIRASVSIPGVFVPMEIDGRQYVDGGLVNRVPVSVARSLGADVVIGVDVGYRGEEVHVKKSLANVMLRAFDIMEWQIAKLRTSDCDIMLRPDVREMQTFQMTQAAQCIAKGREVARANIAKIRELVEG